MNQFLKIANSFLILLGISAPLLWHFYFGPLWVESGESHHHDLGTAIGTVFGYLFALIVLMSSGGLVYALAIFAIKRYDQTRLFIWYKHVASIMLIVPLLVLLLILFSLMLS